MSIASVRKYIEERRKMRGLTPNEIHGLHTGTDREAQITLDDLCELLAMVEQGDQRICNWCGHPKREHETRRSVSSVVVGCCVRIGKENWCPCTASRGVVRMPRKAAK